MKKATRRLLGAIFALVVAVAVSIGATFAWFTTNDTVNVTGISGQVTSGNSSLEVRLVKSDGTEIDDEHDFGYNIDLSKDIEALTKLKFDAVSYQEETGLVVRDGKKAADKVTVGVAEDSAKAGKYLDFYLMLRSLSKLDVYLGADSKVVSVENELNDKGKILAWDQLTEDVYGTATSKGSPIDAEAANAVRVGFQAVDDASSGWETTTKAGVWAPNEAAIGGAPVDKTTGLNTTGDGKGYWKGNLAHDYEIQLLPSEKQTTSDEKTAIDNAYKYPSYTGIDNGGKDDPTSLVVQLTKGGGGEGSYYTAYLHVVIWIEGTDGDCFNNIFNDKFNVSIQLQAKEPEE